jgi:hypothetical protein
MLLSSILTIIVSEMMALRAGGFEPQMDTDQSKGKGDITYKIPDRHWFWGAG